MKIKEIVKMLVEASSYAEARLTVDDSVIQLLKDFTPAYYDLIREKEEAYQQVLSLFVTNPEP